MSKQHISLKNAVLFKLGRGLGSFEVTRGNCENFVTVCLKKGSVDDCHTYQVGGEAYTGLNTPFGLAEVFESKRSN